MAAVADRPRSARRPSLLAGAGLAAVVALQFLAGHAESSFHALLAAAAFLVLRLWQARRERAARRAAGRALDARLRRRHRWAGPRSPPSASSRSPSCCCTRPTCAIAAGSRSTSRSTARRRSASSCPTGGGGRRRRPIRLFLFERALYVGALPLMLVAAALVAAAQGRADRRGAVRPPVVRRGAERPALPADHQPPADLQLRPQHAADHPDDVLRRRCWPAGASTTWRACGACARRRRQRPARRRGRAARPAADRRRRAPAPDARRAGARASRSPGCSPTRRASSCNPIGAGRDPHVRDHHVADARRRRAAAGRAAAAAAGRADAVRRARRAARLRRPVPRRDGLQPGDRPERSPSRRAPGRSDFLERQRPARFASTDGDPPERDPARVRRSTRRAATTCRSSALRPALAPRRSTPGARGPDRRPRQRRARAAARSRPAALRTLRCSA